MTVAPSRRDADAARDLGCGRAVVAGDDDDADARRVAQPYRIGDLRSRRIEERDEPEEAKLLLGVLASLRWHGACRKAATSDGEHAQPLRRVALEHVEHLLAMRRR